MKTLKYIIIFAITLLGSIAAYPQAVKTSTGNWNDASNWSGNNIGDLVTETVIINANRTSTILNGETYTINNLTLNQNDKLYVNTGGHLNVGDATHPATMTTDQNNELYIDGDLTVWGNVAIPQNITIKITGTFTIKGTLSLNQNANIAISTGGKLDIGGDFTAGQNTNVTITGTGEALVHRNISVDHGSNLNSPANGFQYGGICTDGGNNFCTHATSNSALPIELLSFIASNNTNGETVLSWVTVSEINFDYFEIEQSFNGTDFKQVGEIKGHGTTNEKHNYELVLDQYNGIVYFRLKSVDYDGYMQYSSVISIQSENKKIIKIFPNPTNTDQLTNIFTNFKDDVMIALYDQSGHQVKQLIVVDNQFFLDVSPGLYFVKCYSGTTQTVSKLLIK